MTRVATKPRIVWVFIPNPYEPYPKFHAKRSRKGDDNRYHWWTACGIFADRMHMMRDNHAEAFAEPCRRCYPDV